MHDAEQAKMGRLRKILSGLSDIDSLVVNMFFNPTPFVVVQCMLSIRFSHTLLMVCIFIELASFYLVLTFKGKLELV